MGFKEWWKKKSGGKKALYIIGAVFIFLILVGMASDSDSSTASSTDSGSSTDDKVTYGKLKAEITITHRSGYPAYDIINRNDYDWHNVEFTINDYYKYKPTVDLVEAGDEVYAVHWMYFMDAKGRPFSLTDSTDIYEFKITTDEGSASYA